MFSLSLLVALCGASPPSSGTVLGAPSETATAVLDLYVFEAGEPVSDLSVEIGGRPLGATNEDGELSATIPSGRQQLVVLRGGSKVVDLDLLTDDGEVVQIIATLQRDGKAKIDIESSGETSPLASTRAGQQAEGAAAELLNRPPGALVGTVTSSEENKPIANARVFFSGSSVEGRTDEEGRYAVELPAGTYSLSVVHPDFATQTLDDIRVIPGKEVTANIGLTPAGVRLEDYVVTAPYVEGSIASMLEAQRETSSVLDVLGAEQMAATGDSDAAEALQRVSGLTIEDNKFVLVRGQPSRYTLTLWNGSPLPSPEPLVRTIPLDLFPTGVLSGIEVQKSYTADRLASFGSGLVNLKTRGIPDEGFVSLTVDGGYNSESTFLEGLTYRGGSLDAFGFDDGTRALPDEVQATIDAGRNELPAGNDALLQAFGRTFVNNYNEYPTILPPDFGIGVTAGDSIEIPGGGTLGVVASAKWGTSWRRQIRAQRLFVAFGGDTVLRDDTVEARTDFNSDIGSLVTIEAAWKNHRVASNTFYSHQTQQRTEFGSGNITRSQQGNFRSFLLSWIERQLFAQQLTGSHDFGLVKAEYRAMYAGAGRYAPDRRTTDYLDQEPTNGQFIVFGNSGMTRQYDTVDDRVLSLGLDFTIPVLDHQKGWLGLEAKVGGEAFQQDRDAVRRVYRFRPERRADVAQNNPEILYDPIFAGDTLRFGDFSARQQDDSIGFLYSYAGYALLDSRLGDLFRVVGGVRYESTDVEVTTYTIEPDEPRAVTGGFLQEQFFPSLSGTWFLNEDMQVRAAYGRTTSYPNLNELSTAQFVEPDSGEQFFGDKDLQPAIIDGVDLRWEWYPTTTESLTFGGFWKEYENPVERTFISRSGTTPVGTFQNARLATIFGVEVSGRYELGHLRDWIGGPEFLDDLYLVGNLAVMTSEVELSRQGIATNLRRTLDGQADYAFNVQGGYSGEVHDITVALNAVGRRLHRAGIEGLGDVFLEPIERLDIVWTWRMWQNDETIGIFRLAGANLTNPTFTWLQNGREWRSFETGANIDASFKLTFR